MSSRATRTDRLRGASRRVIAIGSGILSVAIWNHAATQEAAIDIAAGPFAPKLVVDNSPLCADFVANTSRLIASSGPLDYRTAIELPGITAIAEEDLAVEPGASDAPGRSRQRVLTTYGRKLYIRMDWNPGCGGACETYQVYASPGPFPADWEERRLQSPTPPSSPESTNPRLLRSDDDRYYVALAAGKNLELVQLNADARWDTAC